MGGNPLSCLPFFLDTFPPTLTRSAQDWASDQEHGDGEYLGTVKRGLIDPGPARGQFATPARYEAFVREGMKEG